MTPNRRPRVVEAADLAASVRRTFADRDVEYTTNESFSWPKRMQNVGDSLAIAYGSDKWKPKGKGGRREVELYKHLAESRNRAFAAPGVLKDFRTKRQVPQFGEVVDLSGVPFPKHFAIIGTFEEARLQLYCGEDEDGPVFGDDDDGVVKLTMPDAMIGFSHLRWSADGSGEDEPFLFVYEPKAVLLVIVGEELSVGKDGIEG